MWKDRTDVWVRRVLQAVSHGARGIILNNHAQDAAQIRTQVLALAPVFDFISYEELEPRLSGRPLKKPFCLFTFDDGKAINAEETAPELLRLGIPAVFYLITGLVDTEKTLWFDRLAALRRSGAQRLPGLAECKAMPWKERDQKIDALCRTSEVEADLSDPRVRMMSWDDAARLQEDGFEVGSHTAHHAILTVETDEEARRQLEESAQSLQEHGLRSRAFAFPNGNATRGLVAAALNAGFESTVTTSPVWLGRRDRVTCLPRIYLKERAGEFHIHTKVLAARSGFLLKNPNGEGRRYLFGLQRDGRS